MNKIDYSYCELVSIGRGSGRGVFNDGFGYELGFGYGLGVKHGSGGKFIHGKMVRCVTSTGYGEGVFKEYHLDDYAVNKYIQDRRWNI